LGNRTLTIFTVIIDRLGLFARCASFEEAGAYSVFYAALEFPVAIERFLHIIRCVNL
jgi:hypothetical protein